MSVCTGEGNDLLYTAELLGDGRIRVSREDGAYAIFHHDGTPDAGAEATAAKYGAVWLTIREIPLVTKRYAEELVGHL